MKKFIYIVISLVLSSICSFAQGDTIIKNGVLESYFSYKHRNPVMVKYILYKGGGDCNRSQFSFHTGGVKNSATKKDYIGSGMDIGHLMAAEDVAYDCVKEEKTFYFYNSVPQTPNLNRGIWKHYETEIRKLSQRDSLLVLCGAIYGENKINGTKVSIPTHCWKVVKSLKTQKIVYVLWFTNEIEKNSVKTIPLKDLEKRIGFKLKDLK